MKKTALAIIGTGLTGICVVAVAFIIFWKWCQLRDIAEYLPPKPSTAGVSITATEAKVFKDFAMRHFRFTTKDAADPVEAAKLFDAQLTAAGWEKLTACSSARVYSSVWHHRRKLNGGLHLVFTVLMLDGTREYAGSMVTDTDWVMALRRERRRE